MSLRMNNLLARDTPRKREKRMRRMFENPVFMELFEPRPVKPAIEPTPRPVLTFDTDREDSSYDFTDANWNTVLERRAALPPITARPELVAATRAAWAKHRQNPAIEAFIPDTAAHLLPSYPWLRKENGITQWFAPPLPFEPPETPPLQYQVASQDPSLIPRRSTLALAAKKNGKGRTLYTR